MSAYLTVLGLAALPAVGNFAGGLLAELRPPSARGLNFALHAAAGIVLAVVAVELVPRALDGLSGWWLAGAFGVGGVAYVLVQELVARLQASPADDGGLRLWMVYAAVATDLLTDGLLIGAGSAVSIGLGLTLSAAQVMADVPEGYAVIANLRERGVGRPQRRLLSAAFFVPVLVAATVAFLLLRGQDPRWQLTALMLGAGLLVTAAVEDMVGEAHESGEDERRSLLALTGGFVLFTVVSQALGG